MSELTIKLFASFRQPGLPDRITVATSQSATVRDALELLFAARPALREQMLQPGGRELQTYVQIMLQGRLIRDLQGLDTPVGEIRELACFPPVAGG